MNKSLAGTSAQCQTDDSFLTELTLPAIPHGPLSNFTTTKRILIAALASFELLFFCGTICHHKMSVFYFLFLYYIEISIKQALFTLFLIIIHCLIPFLFSEKQTHGCCSIPHARIVAFVRVSRHSFYIIDCDVDLYTLHYQSAIFTRD